MFMPESPRFVNPFAFFSYLKHTLTETFDSFDFAQSISILVDSSSWLMNGSGSRSSRTLTPLIVSHIPTLNAGLSHHSLPRFLHVSAAFTPKTLHCKWPHMTFWVSLCSCGLVWTPLARGSYDRADIICIVLRSCRFGLTWDARSSFALRSRM